MSVVRGGILLAARACRMLARQLGKMAPGGEVWLDVGAHYGETTFKRAYRDPSLTVYAFEPNFQIACVRVGVLPNYHVFPFAVSEEEGCATFYINDYEEASSLLPIDEDCLKEWVDGHVLERMSSTVVPTVRLDTFLAAMRIPWVDYLKIDTQGADFAVIRSAGDRLKDIGRIRLEVATTATPLYKGGTVRAEVEAYLQDAGFELVAEEPQHHGQETNLTFANRRRKNAA